MLAGVIAILVQQGDEHGGRQSANWERKVPFEKVCSI